ncbi:hypothetical protein FBU59_002746 [Linderina macrospora]|uniref:Uncharacterized protein n=1 Tax=Linderina macrospora TaxID=4868 RepID=A0ACC1JAF2_9FUNG|nr:hypothetical protein FBU59_002746 [Linderina macrospora]
MRFFTVSFFAALAAALPANQANIVANPNLGANANANLNGINGNISAGPINGAVHASLEGINGHLNAGPVHVDGDISRTGINANVDGPVDANVHIGADGVKVQLSADEIVQNVQNLVKVLAVPELVEKIKQVPALLKLLLANPQLIEAVLKSPQSVLSILGLDVLPQL